MRWSTRADAPLSNPSLARRGRPSGLPEQTLMRQPHSHSAPSTKRPSAEASELAQAACINPVPPLALLRPYMHLFFESLIVDGYQHLRMHVSCLKKGVPLEKVNAGLRPLQEMAGQQGKPLPTAATCVRSFRRLRRPGDLSAAQ
eukprot:scaffold178499_cov30-Tisochrysis_lutea.AAC.10